MRVFCKSSISSRLLGAFFIVLIPIILVSLGVNYASMEVVRKEVSDSYNNSLTLVSRQISNSLNNFDAIAHLIFSDSDLNALNQSKYEKDKMWEYLNFREKLRLYASWNDLQSNVGVYLKNKERFFSSRYGGIPLLEGWVDPVIFDESQSTKYRWHFRNIPGNFGGKFLTYIWDSSFSDLIVIIDIDIAPVQDLINNMETQGGGYVFLMDSAGSILYSNSGIELDTAFLFQEIMASQETQGDFIFYEEEEKYMVLFNHIQPTGLVLGMFFQEQEIMGPILKIRNWILIILLLSIGLGTFYVLFSYNTLLKPVYKLLAGMQEVRKGNLKVRICEEDNAELGFIFTQFNHMVGRIDTLINEVYIERLKQQQAQLKFLQSQINPHFLYNCFNFIYLMSVQENHEATGQMALYLERYFRFATRSQNDSVTLRDEIKNVISYIEIQRMRFPNKIDFHINISEEIMELSIPRLIIQPVVENAFVYGFEATDSKGSIMISSEKRKDHVLLLVEDDSSSIKQAEIEYINAQLNKMEENYDGHGLSNTHWRLRLRFGEKAGIRLAKSNERGLKVVYTIPIQME